MRRMTSAAKLTIGLGMVSVLVWLPACPGTADDIVGLQPELPLGTGIVISNPRPNAASQRSVGGPSAVAPAGADVNSSTHIVYVSLASGTYPDGVTAIIQTPRLPGAVTATMTHGGLDAISVVAAEGDTITIDILRADGAPLARVKDKVPPRRPPRVVRTVPPRGKTDVAVNASVIIVFSEPVSPATVSGATIGLVGGGRAVSGSVQILPGSGTVAAFTPNAPLSQNTSYRLNVGQAIVDLEGDPLESAVSVTFTTGASSIGPPAAIRVSPDTAYVLADNTFQLTATVTDAAGNELIDQPVWESSEPAGLRVSSTGLLTALASGNYSVTARIGDVQGTATVYVRGPPASLSIVPSESTVPIDEAVVLSAMVRDRGGFPISAPVAWVSSAPAVAVVASIPTGAMVATVSGLTLGTATITASAGNVSAGARVTVPPRRAVASVSVSPDAAVLIVGEGGSLLATPRDANGDPISTRPISWAIDNPTVATVNASGQVTAVAVGTARATATSEGVSGTATITVTTLSFASLSAGDFHTCGLTVEGAVYCWGLVHPFVSGIDLQTSRPVAIPASVEFTSVAAGAYHTCALTSNGAAYCWGSYNMTGELGDGTTNTGRATPAPVTGGLTFGALTAANHTCGLTMNGEAYCWGLNAAGQLGDGSTANRFVPTRVLGGLTFAALAAGSYDHTCGLTPTGDAYCWGLNGQGELGNGSTEGSHVPVRVSFPLGFTSLVAGGYHNCGLSPPDAYCWGAARVLGNAAGAPSLIPGVVEGGLTFTALSAGIRHTCGLVSDGALYCWGRNDYGQLGDGTTSDRLLPTRVSGGISFSSVSAGGRHTCGQSTDGIAYCWGWNTAGALGNGLTINSTVPMRVLGQ